MDLPDKPGAAGDADLNSDPTKRRRNLMAMWGADIAQLKSLGSKLQAGSTEIENQKSLLTKALDGTQWKGPDADKFRSEWSGQHVASLTKVAQALQEAGQKASKNASEQEQASH
jgi:hypothetical protein